MYVATIILIQLFQLCADLDAIHPRYPVPLMVQPKAGFRQSQKSRIL